MYLRAGSARRADRRERSCRRDRRAVVRSAAGRRGRRELERRSRAGPAAVPARPEVVFQPAAGGCQRVLSDSSKDCWPSLNAVFLPQTIYPGQFFTSANSWRFLLQARVPIFDSGTRASPEGAAAGGARRGAGEPDRTPSRAPRRRCARRARRWRAASAASRARGPPPTRRSRW